MRRCCHLLLALLLLSPLALPASPPPATALTARASSESWTQTSVDDWRSATVEGLLISNNAGGELRLAEGRASGTLVAEPHRAGFAFSALIATLALDQPAGTSATIDFRLSDDGASWSDWRAIAGDQLGGPLLLDASAVWLQYRLTLTSSNLPASPVVSALSFTLLDPAAGPSLADQPQRQPLVGGPHTLTPRPLTITLEGWGASLEHQSLTWRRPRRVVISTQAGQGDSLLQLRLLQATLEQQRLPFAFAIDAQGNLLQGRPALADEQGNVGVVFLGAPTEQGRAALVGLLAWLDEAYGVGGEDLVVDDQTLPELESGLPEQVSRAVVKSHWVFPEGNTADYTERLMLYNPGSQEAHATVLAYGAAEQPLSLSYTIAPGQRLDLIVNEVISDSGDLPIEVFADQPIVAEQTMLFIHDALNAPGIAQPARSWYFAEGSGAQGSDTYLLLYNPQAEEVAVSVQLLATTGVTRTHSLALPPHTRRVLQASALVNGPFGAKVIANRPIVAARTMRFADGGGHLSNGAPALSHTWYFAEGTSEAPYSTTLALLNPTQDRANVVITLFTADGTALSRNYALSPMTRASVNLQDLAPGLGVAASVRADRPIVAERTILFNGGRSGTNTLGAPELAYVWHFSEGRTEAPASEYLLLANPGSKTARVRIEYSTGGEPVVETLTLTRQSRQVIPVALALPGQAAHATTIYSSVPIVAERTILIDNEDGGGGHTSLGTPGR